MGRKVQWINTEAPDRPDTFLAPSGRSLQEIEESIREAEEESQNMMEWPEM